MNTQKLSRRARRAAGTIGAAGLATAIGLSAAAGPASAYPYEPTGWSCLAPFAEFADSRYPADPPTQNNQISSLDIEIAQNGALEARAGKALRLDNATVTFTQNDTRLLEQLWVRTETNAATASGAVPVGADAGDTTTRNLKPQRVATTVETVEGPATQTIAGYADPVTKPVVGDKVWAFTVNYDTDPASANPDPSTPPIVGWYSDGPVTNAATGQFTRTYYTEPAEYAGSVWNVPKDKDGNPYPKVAYAVGHKYLTHTGDTRFPVSAAVAIEATNTVEGVQTVKVDGSWLVNVVDSTPGTINDPTGYADGNHVVTAPPVKLNLPTSTWTPTGAGPVEFRLAAPGSLEGVTTRSTGYDRPGYNRALAIKPFGNVWVRFESESYGSANDCVYGTYADGDTSIPYSRNNASSTFGNARPQADVTSDNPDKSVGDLENPGFYRNNSGSWVPAFGAAGRWVPQDAAAGRPVIATAALTQDPAPQVITNTVTVEKPAPEAPKAAVKKLSLRTSSLKRSKSNRLSFKIQNPNADATSFRVKVVTTGKYRIGGKRRTVTVISRTKAVKVGAGKTKSAAFKLTKQGRQLLKQRKSVRVKVSISAVGGKSKGVTKTLTLKR
ncbi:MAG: hypothetical protein M0P31_12335 [Solirubrobacteraceae bacterium]|nr:hypothetical protein [Solirubrobacteraceae bacterium]